MDKRLHIWRYLFFPEVKQILIIDEKVRKILKFGINKRIFQIDGDSSNIPIIVKESRGFNHKTITPFLENNDSDVVLFLVETRSLLSWIKSVLRKNGFEYYKSYSVFPNFYNPRWIIPKDKRILKKSGGIINPTKLFSIVVWKIMRLLSFCYCSQIIFPSQVIIAKRKGKSLKTKGILTDILAKQFKRYDLDFILYTGVCGVYQKFTAQIVDNNGEVVGYGKIASSDQAKARIYHESETLKMLNNCNFQKISVPQCLFIEPIIPISDVLLLQNVVTGLDIQRIKKITEDHTVTLAELFMHNQIIHSKSEEYLLNVSNILFKIKKSPFIDEFQSLFSIMEKIVKRCYHDLRGVSFHLGLSHGDFSPWNIFKYGKGLYIFDWELSDNRLPLWDLYNFIFHSEILIYSRGADDILNRVFSENSEYGKYVDLYRNLLPDSVFTDKQMCFAIFLCEVVIFYLKYCINQREHGFRVDDSVKTLIRTGCDLLKTVNSDKTFLIMDEYGVAV